MTNYLFNPTYDTIINTVRELKTRERMFFVLKHDTYNDMLKVCPTLADTEVEIERVAKAEYTIAIRMNGTFRFELYNEPGRATFLACNEIARIFTQLRDIITEKNNEPA